MLRLVPLLLLAGCVAPQRRDPAAEARALVQAMAKAVSVGDRKTITPRLRPGLLRPPADDAPPNAIELRDASEQLVRAAVARITVHERAVITGVLGTRVHLEKGSEGWRVDPETLTAALPTPDAALEQLAAALDRLEGDPSLALLTTPLRESILGAARERARGLRELIIKTPTDGRGMLSVQLNYGRGLFVILRPERDGWRIEDFN